MKCRGCPFNVGQVKERELFGLLKKISKLSRIKIRRLRKIVRAGGF
jgi:hypothetical protein